MRDYEQLRENAWEAIYAAREARAQAKLPIMPFRRVFRSNKQALDWLLTREEKGLPPAPSAVLLDWIATIPARSIRARAKRGLIARFGLPNVPYPTNVKMKSLRLWRERPFRPAVYSTDDATGRRVEIPYKNAMRIGLLETHPQEVCEMTVDQFMVFAKSDDGDWGDIGSKSWRDADDREYEVVNGVLRLMR